MKLTSLIDRLIYSNNDKITDVAKRHDIPVNSLYAILSARYSTQKRIDDIFHYYTSDINEDDFIKALELIRDIKEK